MGGLISDDGNDSYTDPTGSTDPDPEEDLNYEPKTMSGIPGYSPPEEEEEDDGVSHGVRDMDQDVADGADETTGEVSLDAAESGIVTDPNAQVEDTGYQVDGDLDDSPGGPAEDLPDNDPKAAGTGDLLDGNAKAVVALALLVVAAIKGGAV